MPNQAHDNVSYCGPYGSRRNSDNDVPMAVTLAARSDPRYKIGPQEDGLHHCPFETTEECSHKPEKLKCNYE